MGTVPAFKKKHSFASFMQTVPKENILMHAYTGHSDFDRNFMAQELYTLHVYTEMDTECGEKDC
jgi:hypothetical protein